MNIILCTHPKKVLVGSDPAIDPIEGPEHIARVQEMITAFFADPCVSQGKIGLIVSGTGKRFTILAQAIVRHSQTHRIRELYSDILGNDLSREGNTVYFGDPRWAKSVPVGDYIPLSPCFIDGWALIEQAITGCKGTAILIASRNFCGCLGLKDPSGQSVQVKSGSVYQVNIETGVAICIIERGKNLWVSDAS